MLLGFESLVEERILKAQKNGEMDNLPGQGKPLNLEDMKIPEEFRMVHRVLKNSGFVPPEVELRKQIRELEDMLKSIDENCPYQSDFEEHLESNTNIDENRRADIKKRVQIKKKLDFLFLKLNTSRGTDSPYSKSFPSNYRQKLIKRML
ncbi:MAG: DUF1992 domain-containing protein [Desulfamplus sp.]|nr:DUF1992 domain-containing protein [Desulfamplus sp.]